MSGVVEVVAVELDDEVLFAPDEVDQVAGDPLAGLRGGETVTLDEAQEIVLQGRAGGAGGVGARREPRCAAAGGAGEESRELVGMP